MDSFDEGVDSSAEGVDSFDEGVDSSAGGKDIARAEVFTFAISSSTGKAPCSIPAGIFVKPSRELSVFIAHEAVYISQLSHTAAPNKHSSSLKKATALRWFCSRNPKKTTGSHGSNVSHCKRILPKTYSDIRCCKDSASVQKRISYQELRCCFPDEVSTVVPRAWRSAEDKVQGIRGQKYRRQLCNFDSTAKTSNINESAKAYRSTAETSVRLLFWNSTCRGKSVHDVAGMMAAHIQGGTKMLCSCCNPTSEENKLTVQDCTQNVVLYAMCRPAKKALQNGVCKGFTFLPRHWKDVRTSPGRSL
eukprot:207700-Prorocentrum_minimum.AAC.1